MDNASRIAHAIGLFDAARFDEALSRFDELLDDTAADADLCNTAAACAFRLGRPAEAERYWRLALQRDPRHAASWNNLGILLQQQGRVQEAEAAYRQALAVQPAYAEAHYNLGLLLQQAGALDAASACYGRTLALCPGHANAHNNLGAIFRLRGQWPEAEASLRRAVAARADFAAASVNLAGVLEEQGRVDEAQQQYGHAIHINPADAGSLQRRADLLQRLGRWNEAATCYRAALALRPDSPQSHNNFAALLVKLGDPETAERCYRRALELAPGYADALHNLALLYIQQRRHAAAEQALGSFLALRPGEAEGLISLGNLYQQIHRYDAAERAYRQALAIRPAHAKALNNLAASLQQQRRFDQAEAVYRQAIDAAPDYPEPRWNLGFMLLSRGRMPEGWPWMEARYDPALARPIAARPDLPFPQWQGEDLAGRSIVVWPEQGFGDQIQFVRYLPLLKARGARQVTLVCKDALVPLLRGAAGAGLVLGESAAATRLPAHDFWVFIMSLPMHFATTAATIPAALPYLAPATARVEQWRGRLALPGLRVGLVWRGFGGHVNDVNRSLPDLSSLAPVLQVPGVSFVSLQRGMDAKAVTPGGGVSGVLDLGPEIGDFADTAAIVSLLDLVICVDTAVAHVAGALGKPCWVLLPAVHPDWRWMEERNDSPWYPGALTLYRQTTPGEWSEVVDQVAVDLAAWLPRA